MNIPEIIQEVPDKPGIRLKKNLTDLELILYKGPFDFNINLISNIVDSYANLYDVMPMERNHRKTDLFSFKKNQLLGDGDATGNPTYGKGIIDLRNNLTQAISQSIRSLIFHGSAWLEIILGLNQEGNVKQVRFQPLYAEVREKRGKIIKFSSITWDDKPINFTINSRFLVLLSLKDMGFPENLFIEVFRKIRNIPLIDYTGEQVMHPKPWYTFHDMVNNRNVAMLKATKDIYYADSFINNSGLLSDFHLIYRICHYKMIKRKILDYILDKINHALLELEKEYLFQGQTVLNVPAINYIKYYDKLIAGDITIKEIFDIFQYGKIQKHK
ncbi:hypothetical protein [uncultured Dialister sp.]|jgi:hypothetical protein|uniref:hypothetical protein n=1 Tax=uncultured Dialister sp. TaxID=278064 RepID=UPI00267024FD|nr:hypothetical protein [uncultured Dialister sp.]